MVGGLLKAQDGGGDAGKVDIGIVVDQRMTQQSDMQYQHLVRDEDIAIYPVDDGMNAAWNGTGPIDGLHRALRFDRLGHMRRPSSRSTSARPTARGSSSRTRAAGAGERRLPQADAVAEPGIRAASASGRPSRFKNNGWGDVQGRLDLACSSPARTRTTPMPAARFTKQIGSFGNGADVFVDDLLAEAGVDTQKLASERFSCQSMDSINVCKSQVFNSVGFGEIADFVWGDQKLMTSIKGTLNYSWADDNRQCLPVDRAVQRRHRAGVYRGAERAGRMRRRLRRLAGGAALPGRQAADQPARLLVDLPIRGNKNLASYVARLKMPSAMSSFHQFQVVAKFADGSERRSKTVSLFYYRPKPSDFVSTATPAACYLQPEAAGC